MTLSFSRLRSVLALILASSAAMACGSRGEAVSSAGGRLEADGGTPCTTTADCGPSSVCAFGPGAKCGDPGVCFAQPSGPTCTVLEAGCSCGASVTVACETLPDGYSPYPEFTPSSAGASCGATEPDAGTCTTDSDCGASGVCGFPRVDACTAKGVCFPRSLTTCNSFLQGCACDGTTTNLACNDLPDTYSPKPLLHTGACGDGG